MKTKIAAIITALLIIFVGAGGVYFISQSTFSFKDGFGIPKQEQDEKLPENQSVRMPEEQEPPEPVDTRVEDWLKLLGEELEIESLDIEDLDFEWALENETVDVSGQRITQEQTDEDLINTVLELFEQNEFEQDAYNLALGDYVELYGYVKDDLVCLVRSTTTPESEPGVIDLEIECGLADLESAVKAAQEEIVIQLFTEKYEREASTVNVDIIQSTFEHMSGSVQFIEPDEEQPTSGNVGAFLAAKDEDGEWVLVFDGNGAIYCSDIEPYDFPIEIVPECYDEAGGQVIDRTIQ